MKSRKEIIDMVYLYYGFYMFLLFLTASFWVFLTVAALSWIVLRRSDGMYRSMRTPLEDFRI